MYRGDQMSGWGFALTGAMGWFWIWPALVLIGLVLLGYLGYRLAQGRPGTGSRDDTDTARRILDQRFARGEIDEEEYRRRRSALQ
jgi:putative membrane protein